MGECILIGNSYKAKKGDDNTNAPGPKELIAGDMQAGYFGTVAASEIFTGSEIALACGITQGTLQHDTIVWLKFAYEGKILFRPQKAIRYSISWDHINSMGCVFGIKIVSKNGVNYKVRLMKGSTVDPAVTANNTTNTMTGSEWNGLMLPIHEQAATKAWAYPNYVEGDVPNWGIGFTDADLLMQSSNGNGSYVWCQEVSTSNAIHRVYRGGSGVSSVSATSGSSYNASRGWAPVLEVIE